MSDRLSEEAFKQCTCMSDTCSCRFFSSPAISPFLYVECFHLPETSGFVLNQFNTSSVLHCTEFQLLHELHVRVKIFTTLCPQVNVLLIIHTLNYTLHITI